MKKCYSNVKIRRIDCGSNPMNGQPDPPFLASLEYSLKRLMLKLKLQYFGHMMQRIDSLEKTLMLGKIEVKRRRE